MELIQSRPEVCLVELERGLSLLPWLCDQGSSTFSALTERVATLHPTEIIKQHSFTGDTCLHTVARNACRFSDTKLQQLLLLCPDPAAAILIRNRRGGTVLHAAASGAACLSALQTIVQTNPQVLRIPSYEHIYALAVLWQSYGETIPGHLTLASILENAPVSGPNSLMFQQFWTKVEYLALQYFALSISIQKSALLNVSLSPSYVLHGLLLGHAPLSLLQFCLHYQPVTASATDTSGNRPLHVLVTNRPYAGKKEREAVAAVVRAAPSAARIPNGEGVIPLQLAIYNKAPTEIVEILLAAAPETISCRDVVHGLYPFQLAAAEQGSSIATVNTIYRLLRQQPDLLFVK